jgi:hypothetical protein
MCLGIASHARYGTDAQVALSTLFFRPVFALYAGRDFDRKSDPRAAQWLAAALLATGIDTFTSQHWHLRSLHG